MTRPSIAEAVALGAAVLGVSALAPQSSAQSQCVFDCEGDFNGCLNYYTYGYCAGFEAACFCSECNIQQYCMS
jgi:hypothetical protein